MIQIFGVEFQKHSLIQPGQYILLHSDEFNLSKFGYKPKFLMLVNSNAEVESILSNPQHFEDFLIRILEMKAANG